MLKTRGRGNRGEKNKLSYRGIQEIIKLSDRVWFLEICDIPWDGLFQIRFLIFKIKWEWVGK